MSELTDATGGPRPLSARSVIATSLLGAAVAEVRAAHLVRAGALFGIAEGAMRTALWRMAADGEVVAHDGWYRLAGRLLERKDRVDEGQAPVREPWDGTWELAVVAAERRPASERLALRSAALALHLAEVREGTWARPANLPTDRLPAQQAVLDAQCLRFTGASAPEGLGARIFDLDGWSARAGELVAAMDATDPARPVLTAAADPGEPGRDGHVDPDALANAFTLAVAVVRHLQADPLLPDELLPADWPGAALRRRYVAYDRAYKQQFTTWLLAEG
jgi:phenylacetic acid degradation operon negative regulatory protein